MFARAHTFTIDGFQTRHVTVEVDIRAGLPAFAVVGLADAAVREARERVRTAIRNSGYEFPARRITANLAPGDVPKAGPALDLPLACADRAIAANACVEMNSPERTTKTLRMWPGHPNPSICFSLDEPGTAAEVATAEPPRDPDEIHSAFQPLDRGPSYLMKVGAR